MNKAQQDEQEPVAWASPNVIPLRGLKDNHPCILTAFKCEANTVALYTVPPKRQPLSAYETQKLRGSMSKHTKGPWFVTYSNTVEYGECVGVGISTEPSKTPICIVSKTENVNPIDKENARLIAAAPELLEALIVISEESTDLGARECAIQAIAKAKGEG